MEVLIKLVVVASEECVYYGGPQLSRQKQIVSLQKQIASRQKQTGYGKSKLEMAKANLLRQKQIGNGNSQLVKVESKFVTAKANCTLRKCQTADEHRNRSGQKQNSILIPKAKGLQQKQISYFTATYTSLKQTHSSQKQITFASRKSNNSYLDSLSIHSEGLGAK